MDDEGKKDKALIFNYGDKAWNQLKLIPVALIQLNNTEAIGSGYIKGNKEVLGRFTMR